MRSARLSKHEGRRTLKNLQHVLLPSHVHLARQADPVAARHLQETSMLSAHAESLDVSQMLFQEVRVPTRDDVDDVLGVCRERSKRVQERGGGGGGGGVLDDRGEGAVCSCSARPRGGGTYRSRRAEASSLQSDTCPTGAPDQARGCSASPARPGATRAT